MDYIIKDKIKRKQRLIFNYKNRIILYSNLTN